MAKITLEQNDCNTGDKFPQNPLKVLLSIHLILLYQFYRPKYTDIVDINSFRHKQHW